MTEVFKIIRNLFFAIDTQIYYFVENLYNLFSVLTQSTIFTDTNIKEFSSKIYVLISLIMAFRLAFAFITYIVNPETLTDKQKGGATLLKNVVVSITLLASVPLIFQEAYYLQSVIVRDGVIEKLVMGESTSEIKTTPAKQIAAVTFLSFFHPSSRLIGCSEKEMTSEMTKCVESINAIDTSKKGGNAYKAAYETLDLSNLFEAKDLMALNIALTDTAQEFKDVTVWAFNYSFGITTAVGVFLAMIIFGFCLDVSIRIVKLGFLQLIAPIPIIMYMAPGKKSTNLLTSWGKECANTWISLFIRIAVVSFSVYLITILGGKNGIISTIGSGFSNNTFVSAFLTIGILMFAKEFPKLIEELTGIKGGGKLTLNPFKKLNEDMLGGGLLGGATAGLLGGGIGGAFRGAIAGASGKKFSEGMEKAAGKNRLWREAQQNGSGLLDRMSARYNKLTGGEMGMEERLNSAKLESEKGAKLYENRGKELEERKKKAEAVIQKTRRTIEDNKGAADAAVAIEDRAKDQIQHFQGAAGAKYNGLLADVKFAEQSGAGAAAIATAQKAADDYLNNDGIYDYINQVKSGGHTDLTLGNKIKAAEQKFKYIGREAEFKRANGKEMHSIMGQTKGVIAKSEIDSSRSEREIRSLDDRIKIVQAKKADFDKRRRKLDDMADRVKANNAYVGKK